MLLRLFISISFALFFSGIVFGQGYGAVVADSVTRKPLPSASIFDLRGRAVGICGSDGVIPYIPASSYPITVRYLGFKEKVVRSANSDTIFLEDNFTELPEVIVQSRKHKVLHMLAYIREYSTLSTYTDTVFLFREKMVDYMLTPDKKVRFNGWSVPRILKCKSYYHFTNDQGLDSISDESNYHFSWSDWVGVAPASVLPDALKKVDCGSDTVKGRYRATEFWTKNKDRVNVAIDVLEDTTSRKWVANLKGFFRGGLDFEKFTVRFNYDNVDGDTLSPMDLSGYSYNIESRGRGHSMFMFNSVYEPFFVSTYAEVYILDKEYISVKEAKKWDRYKFNKEGIEIIEAPEAPDLQPEILALVERVENIDKYGVRLGVTPDHRLAGGKTPARNFSIAYRALDMLKQLTGISHIRTQRKFNNNWRNFTKEQIKKNNSRHKEND